MNKPVKMVLTQYYNGLQPFLISDDNIEVGDMVCELLTTGQWLPMTIHTENDIDVDRQKKIIVTSDEYSLYPNIFPSPLSFKISKNSSDNN